MKIFKHSVAIVLIMIFIAGNLSAQTDTDSKCFEQAEVSSKIAGYSLSKVKRWLHEVAIKKIDPVTGLYIGDGRWNYRDTAADCYPFLCWAAYVTDIDALNGPIRDVLDAERRLCNHLGRTLPLDHDWEITTDKRKVS